MKNTGTLRPARVTLLPLPEVSPFADLARFVAPSLSRPTLASALFPPEPASRFRCRRHLRIAGPFTWAFGGFLRPGQPHPLSRRFRSEGLAEELLGRVGPGLVGGLYTSGVVLKRLRGYAKDPDAYLRGAAWRLRSDRSRRRADASTTPIPTSSAAETTFDDVELYADLDRLWEDESPRFKAYAQSRVRGLTLTDAARAASIRPTSTSRLEKRLKAKIREYLSS